MPLATIEQAIAALRAGRFVIIVDGPDRENEGDLCIAGQFITPEAVNFIVREARGLLCAAMAPEWVDRLRLPLMVDPASNSAPFGTAFTVSVEARQGVTTGISAHDRARTIRTLADPASTPADFAMPGHVFPLRARPGGVLERPGQTEAAVDLARLAGLYPAGVLCEIVNDDGTMARVPDLVEFCKEHGLLMVTIAQLIRYRRQNEKLIRRVAEARIPTPWGDFTSYVYESLLDGEQHVAMVRGAVQGESDVLVRVHSECLTGDVFHSLRCDCGIQLDAAMAEIDKEGMGVLVYLRGHEGRGIGLGHKIRAYSLQEQGHDTVDANVELGLPIDSREYGIGAQILNDLGITTMRLMTNNPAKYGGLEGFGLEITGRVPLESTPNPENIGYLRTKRERMGHLLEGLD